MKAYQYEGVRGIKKPLAAVPAHFAMGLLFHAMRARWFTLRFADDTKAWESIQEAADAEQKAQDLPMPVAVLEDALALMGHYITHWSRQPKPTPIATEHLLGPAPISKGDPFFLYRTARLDDLSKYPEALGEVCIGESKTASTSIGQVVQEYEMHPQPLLQYALYSNCENGEKRFGPAAGIMLDITVKGDARSDPKFGRVFVPVTDVQRSWFGRSMAGYLRAAASVDWDTDAPRNPLGCTYMAGRARVDCTFKELCMHGKSSSGSYVMRDGSSLRAHQPRPGQEKMPWE